MSLPRLCVPKTAHPLDCMVNLDVSGSWNYELTPFHGGDMKFSKFCRATHWAKAARSRVGHHHTTAKAWCSKNSTPTSLHGKFRCLYYFPTRRSSDPWWRYEILKILQGSSLGKGC